MPVNLPHPRACCKAACGRHAITKRASSPSPREERAGRGAIQLPPGIWLRIACLCFLLFALTPNLLADWQRDDTSIAWLSGTNVVWRFSFDPAKGKPFFHPVSVAGGPALTNFKPEDHPWHYGLWFSWKYINPFHSTNHYNYWEEDRATGTAQGKTRWGVPVIQTKPDGSATIRMDLKYISPSNQVDLTEQREIAVSAPSLDGSYIIRWKAHFVAGPEPILLDRTAMPGEPNGQTNGGYAGLAFRMAGLPLNVNMLSTAGPVTNFISDRARPRADAVGFNFTDDDKPVGSLAIFSGRAFMGRKPPWYLVNEAARTFRFASAAILAPRRIAVRAGGPLDLEYCIIVQPAPWTVESLKAAQASSFP
jgi:hypothetical protein